MASYILKPSYTTEMLVSIFNRLCCAEVRKRIGFQSEMQEGFQNGYIYCLTDLFGQISDEEHEKMFDAGQSYLHIIDKIVEFGLQVTIDAMKNNDEELSIEDLKLINALVLGVVRQYIKDNLQEVSAAIRNL